jgi:hypothetical protein
MDLFFRWASFGGSDCGERPFGYLPEFQEDFCIDIALVCFLYLLIISRMDLQFTVATTCQIQNALGLSFLQRLVFKASDSITAAPHVHWILLYPASICEDKRQLASDLKSVE